MCVSESGRVEQRLNWTVLDQYREDTTRSQTFPSSIQRNRKRKMKSLAKLQGNPEQLLMSLSNPSLDLSNHHGVRKHTLTHIYLQVTYFMQTLFCTKLINFKVTFKTKPQCKAYTHIIDCYQIYTKKDQTILRPYVELCYYMCLLVYYKHSLT